MTTAAAESPTARPHRFAVWGDPIDHSRSPALHGAAYALLGWPWEYGRRRVDEASFSDELAALPASVRGLSLTMPLKSLAHHVAVRRDADAEATGAANTLVRVDEGWAGFNTDVGGLARALVEAGAAGAERARVVGAGATATSALLALHRLGVVDVEVAARRPESARPLVELAERLGMVADVAPLGRPGDSADLTVSTLPGDAPVAEPDADRLAAAGGVLYDVVYGTWPTGLASAWQRAGRPAHPGGTMLLHQAVLQIRIFATGDADQPLPDEEAVVAVMRRALVGG
ncbi:shikimate dehydrogenase [Microbacterium sp. NM3R9]|uniref:shikimate dehydrogenase n=1 Tax=Microbacterium thalli TaxID=3027921 RepID=UPI0023672B34|nr:shikimate dehydrogenase [Microbacterium thalli]MDN8548655.1 shikimate dehydrogenase [Microbacterium thalli]